MISTNSFQRRVWVTQLEGGRETGYKGCDRGWASRTDGQEEGREG